MPENEEAGTPAKNVYQRPPRAVAEKPRRVRGGVRLGLKEWPPVLNATAHRWLECLQRLIDEDRMVEGLEYARAGQTRRLEREPGALVGIVQGRKPRAYRAELRISTCTPDEWERVVQLMADQAIFAAKLLAGEVPEGVEDAVREAGVRLFELRPEDISTKCACDDQRPCKHAACIGILVAEALNRDPFLVFSLRGLPAEDFLERLRQRRALSSAGGGLAYAYTHQVIPGAEAPSPPLEALVERFWEAGAEIARLETRIEPPAVTNALLRRLGQSPFEGRFPLVGLLATCYETISRKTIEESTAQEPAEPDDGEER